MSIARMSVAAQCYLICLLKTGESDIGKVDHDLINAVLKQLNPTSKTEKVIQDELTNMKYLSDNNFTKKALEDYGVLVDEYSKKWPQIQGIKSKELFNLIKRFNKISQKDLFRELEINNDSLKGDIIFDIRNYILIDQMKIDKDGISCVI